MDGLFLKLLNMSISATWLVGIVLVLRLVLKKAPKWMHCVLWALVAVRLICPFSFESSLSMLPSAEVLPSRVIASGDIQVNTGFEIVDTRINSGILEGYMEGVTVPVGNTLRIMTVLTILWLSGMLLMAAYAFFSYARLRRQVAASVETAPDVRICDYIGSPFILGIVKPQIYLPSDMAPEAVESVLAHEQAHIRRKDHWWKPLGYLLLTIHWFNPVMWLAYILLCRDIEMACDEKVIREMDAPAKKRYSEALLACAMPRHLIAACPLAFGEVGVKERVKSVLNYRKPAFWLILAAVIACIIAAVCFLTDPAANTIAKQFEIEKIGDFAILAGEETVSVTNNSDLEKFLKSAKISELPISQDRSEDRAKDFGIALSAGGAVLYFDSDFSDVWMNDGVKPSLSYRLEDPDQARSFFEEILGIDIPEAVSGGPDENGNYYFTATVLRVNDSTILVEPMEGCWERTSSDKIWVSLKFQSAKPLPEIRVADTVRIFYDGMVAETYPAQVNWVYNIEVVENTKNHFIAAVISDMISDITGTDDITLFDYTTIGNTAVFGFRYGDRYGVAYRSDSTVSITLQEDLIGDPAEGVFVDTTLAENGSLAVLITNPEVWDLCRGDMYREKEEEREYFNYGIHNFPALILMDHGENGTVLYAMKDDASYQIYVEIPWE